MTDTDENSSIIEESAKRTDSLDKYYAQFLSKLWVTKGCRFQANHRLARKNQAAILTVSLLSIYVIAGSLVTLIAPAGTLTQNTVSAINLILVVTSIFILVLSNIEAGKNYALRSHVMLKCAQQISELYNQVEFLIKTGNVTPEAFNAHIKHYDKIIADFSDNHDDIDYLCFQASHWRHFNLSGLTAYRKTIVRRTYRFMNIWGYYLAMLLPPPLLFAVVMGKTPSWLQ